MIESELKGDCNIGFWDQAPLFKEELLLKIKKLMSIGSSCLMKDFQLSTSAG
ncbi:hypothetical protein [Pedobacter sp. UYP1]|uniref:hypothetical protein n=1 Tax=Pedobacter sp. UYP1 TaxID=1756396 RepID=UPI003393E91B